ncbi:hypothetical protein [Streptomyces sp. NRRL WC-3742]|uniref:hypothetical protein n=1 Tax=Streptomyces sp. NRRL WC-3742 TaxID=1463934 RepID=UPI00131D0570|nr:hypothetical protein [Streptomyces sp. NRRL WC-3742]
MTATNDAPDPRTTDADRWQPILQKLADLETRVRTLGDETTAALATHLARLDALRHQLAHPAWPDHEAAHEPGPSRAPSPAPRRAARRPSA